MSSWGLQNRIVYDVVDLVEGRCRLAQALIRDRHFEGLYLLPAAQTRDKSAVSPADMVRICEQLRGECDYILIDSPAGIETGFRNAVAPADAFILITTPDVVSIQDVDRVLGILESEGREGLGLVINRLRPDLVRRQEMLSPDDVLETLAIKLLGIIPEAEEILVSSMRGLPAAQEQNTLATRAYRNIARRLEGEDVPFLPVLEGRTGFWQRLGFRGR